MMNDSLNTSFADLDLDEPLQRAIINAGWKRPTPVQRRVIPALLDGRDLLVSAATGSGKTGAFLLPILQRLAEQPDPFGGIRALVLVPTRELAQQIHKDFLALGRRTRLTATPIIGGDDRRKQIASLRKNPDLVIATPGRLLEHLGQGEADLATLGFLVLDEADRMLDLGFAEDVLAIVNSCGSGRQSLLFSATLKHGGLRPLTDRLLRDPLVIEVDPIRAAHPDISHQIILSDDLAQKQTQLLWLLQREHYEKALVFTNTRARADALGHQLAAAGIRAAALHGELDQRERRRVIGLLERGAIQVLVASDVAARGLHLAGVERVINLEVPRSGKDYLHRSGRTGRAGKAGVAISLVSGPEWNKMESITRWLGIEISLRQIPGLESHFKGPKRARKSRAKASAEPPESRNGKPRSKGPKQRLRDRKTIGKRRQPSAGHSPDNPVDVRTDPDHVSKPSGGSGQDRPNRRRNDPSLNRSGATSRLLEAGFAPPRRSGRKG